MIYPIKRILSKYHILFMKMTLDAPIVLMPNLIFMRFYNNSEDL